MKTLLVITTPEAAYKLDHSMLVLDGCQSDGYTYDHEVFFMEGIKDSEWCEVGATCNIRSNWTKVCVTIKFEGECEFYVNTEPCGVGWEYVLFEVNNKEDQYMLYSEELLTPEQVVLGHLL